MRSATRAAACAGSRRRLSTTTRSIRSPAERAALALCARGASVGDLLSLPHARPQLIRAVHALLWGGLIENAPIPRPARGARAPRHGLRRPPTKRLQPEPEPEPEGPRSPEEAEKLARSFLDRGHRERAL